MPATNSRSTIEIAGNIFKNCNSLVEISRQYNLMTDKLNPLESKLLLADALLHAYILGQNCVLKEFEKQVSKLPTKG